MKFRQAWLAVMVVAALAACNGHHETVTGTYGQGMLSGQVVMSQVPNSSPAGVQVTVRGTGMTQTLAADGQFVFAGVPDGAQLDFTRAEDGIEASLAVGQSTGFVVIELAQNTAKKSSRRRGVGATREKVYEFEGTITAVDGTTSLTMFTSHKEEVTINLTDATIVRKGNRILTLADLAADMHVHVKSRKVEDAYSAILVIVQEPDDDSEPPAVTEYEGVVRSAAADQLVVFTSHKEEVTFVLNADTVIRKGNTTVAATDILPGMTVHVKATTSEDGTTKTATLVILQNTRVEVELEGTVASVGTSSLVVTTADGDITVNVANSTLIRKQGKKIALSAIAVGDKVEVEGVKVDATTVNAQKITVQS